MAETTEQLELAAARAATARLSRTTARWLGSAARLSRTRRLFGRSFGTARGLSGTRRLFSRAATAGFRSATATAAMMAEQLETRIGLAFHDDHCTHQGRQSNGGLHYKTLTHRKSSN
jgi:hypothetical protein